MLPKFTRRRTLKLLGITNPVTLGFLSRGHGSTSQNSASTWTQRAKLIAEDGESEKGFGRSIALDGTTALVGYTGAAYVFTDADGSWSQQAKIIAQNAEGHDYFGQTVALDDQTALIGARHDDDPNGSRAGSAYIFTQTDETWTRQAKLAASDGQRRDRFGQSVAIDSDTALIGADQGDKPGGGNWTGKAYVFTRADGDWTQTATLTPEDDETRFFGWAVTLDDDIAVIGARMSQRSAGEAYVFTRSADEWTQQAHLTGSNRDPEDSFGGAVALDGDTAVIGAPRNEDQNGRGSGSAYVFSRANGTWEQQATLSAADGDTHDSFGASVGFDGETILVAANTDEDPHGKDAGSAYIFTHRGGEWGQETKLVADDGDSFDYFGESAALENNTAIVGAYADEDPLGYFAGSAYVYWKDQKEVALDIKPDSETNPINPNGKGVIPVAILHTDSFDPVARIDVSSLRFGAPDVVDNGGGATPAHQGGHTEDSNDDGADDLLLHFPTEDTGFEQDDDEGKIVGETDDGVAIFGIDTVTVRGNENGGSGNANRSCR